MQNTEIRELADEIRAQLLEVPSTYPEYCIGRVNKECRDAHREAFIPRTLSIGPLHLNKRHLTIMEQYKHCYTKSFLQENPQMVLEDYLRAMQGLEERARRCYGEQIELNSRRFKKMMLYDGCFVIELFLRFKKETPGFGNDPIFSRVGLLNGIKHDLILFENQLPFFVLQCLFNISGVFNGGPSLIDLALHFFSDLMPPGHKVVAQEKGPDVKHLLDLLRQSYAPSYVDTQPLFENEPDQVLLYSATDLIIKAAIKFRVGKAESLLDIRFFRNGRMEIPRLKLQAETGTLFRNLIAFEQCCESSNTYITDYISFMGGLVKDWDDANLLCDMGIIESDLPNVPLRAADLFRTLRKELIIRSGYYSRICQRVNSHCMSPRRDWMDNLVIHCRSILCGGIILMFMWLIGFEPLISLIGGISHHLKH